MHAHTVHTPAHILVAICSHVHTRSHMCTHTHTCAYTCIHMLTHVHILALTFTEEHTHPHICVHTCTHHIGSRTHMHTCAHTITLTYTHTCARTCTCACAHAMHTPHICLHTHMHAHPCACAHSHIHMHAHTHTKRKEHPRGPAVEEMRLPGSPHVVTRPLAGSCTNTPSPAEMQGSRGSPEQSGLPPQQRSLHPSSAPPPPRSELRGAWKFTQPGSRRGLLFGVCVLLAWPRGLQLQPSSRLDSLQPGAVRGPAAPGTPGRASGGSGH